MIIHFYHFFLGYCFSASAPPLLTQAAISALDRFEAEPQIFQSLNNCAKSVHETFSKLSKMKLNGHVLSPVKHLYLKNEYDRNTENDLIDRIVNEVINFFAARHSHINNHSFSSFTQCYQKNLALVNPEYLDTIEVHCPRPSIRLTVNCLLSEADISFAYETLESVTKAIVQL